MASEWTLTSFYEKPYPSTSSGGPSTGVTVYEVWELRDDTGKLVEWWGGDAGSFQWVVTDPVVWDYQNEFLLDLDRKPDIQEITHCILAQRFFPVMTSEAKSVYLPDTPRGTSGENAARALYKALPTKL